MTHDLRAELTLHSAVNERGVAVDRAFAESLHATWIAMKLDARDEIAMATGGKLARERASSGPAVHAWLRSVGVKVASLRKDFIATILDDPDALGAGDDETAALVSHVLRLRADVVRAGEGKVARLVGTLDADDRLRRMFVFHGAATGRFSSRVVQVHNLPRGVDGVDVEELCREPLTPERVRQAAGDKSPSDVLATLVRPCFVASPGRTLCIADFASVEGRCVAWMAGESSLLATFAAGGDVYCDMASGLYGREITKADKTPRQVGKTIILGCIAKGTPILTSNGWKTIETVSLDDRVWDGVEWVTHGGVVNKGEKPVINVNGVWMTRDHEILTSKGWIEAWQVQEGTHTLPVVDVSGNGQLLLREYRDAEFSAHAERLLQSSPTTSTGAYLRDVISARKSRHGELRSSRWDTFKYVQTRFLGRGFSIVFPLSYRDATTLQIEAIGYTERGESRYTVYGGLGGPSSFDTCCHYLDMTTQRLRSTELTTTATTNRETYNSQLAASKSETVVTTYDILNAGPRKRFQAGLLIVHNCGYQMGHANFARVCATQRINLEAAGVTAEQCVKAYRERYPAIPKLWKSMQEAATLAVRSGGVQVAGRCSYAMKGMDLVCTLPSGRNIIYREARIMRQVPRWAVLTGRTDIPESDCLVYQHHHGFAKELYGGLLTENCLGRDTRVVTDRGVIPITEVTSSHRVWDGETWVRTNGVKSRGIQEVGKWLGVTSTADHLITDGSSWRSAIASDGQFLSRSLSWAHGSVNSLQFVSLCGHKVNAMKSSSYSAIADGLALWRSVSYCENGLLSASHAQSHITSDEDAVSRGLWQDTGRREEVFDLMDCGPRRRFTIITDAGPIVVHNCSQAICRDLLVAAMIELYRMGHEIVLHVHDEIVTEADDHTALDEVCRVMSTPPTWAEGFPVEVEGFTGPRYVKSPFRDAYEAHYRGGVRCSK